MLRRIGRQAIPDISARTPVSERAGSGSATSLCTTIKLVFIRPNAQNPVSLDRGVSNQEINGNYRDSIGYLF